MAMKASVSHDFDSHHLEVDLHVGRLPGKFQRSMSQSHSISPSKSRAPSLKSSQSMAE
jgi:hypothetical protein